MKLVDVNAATGFWPIQHLSHPTLESLDALFATLGVEEVWLSALESVLYPEPDTWDLRLFERLPAFPRFRPVKTVNPLLANWRSHWEKVPLAAIKLFPAYHGYLLSHPSLDLVCQAAAQEELPVLVTIRMNDERNQPASMQVPPVPVGDLLELSRRHPRTTFIALCCYGHEVATLAQGGERLLAECSFLDGIRALERAAGLLGQERLLFGSHAPLLHPHSARLKVDFADLPRLAAALPQRGTVFS